LNAPYLDAFDEDKPAIEELKRQYRQGGLGDSVVKRRLEVCLQELLAPIRERRSALAKDPSYIHDVIRTGTLAAREITQQTLDAVKTGMGLYSLQADNDPV
jgi:tryptophanyl-tRNA synthetase